MWYLRLALVATFGLLAFSVLDVLALHDIYQDYVSPKIRWEYATTGPEGWPWWTACAQEWGLVEKSVYARFGLLAANVVLLVLVAREVRRLRAVPG